MLLTPAQNKIAACTNRFRVICSGRRFGKTTLAVEEIKGKALAKSSKIAYCAPTYAQARDICWEILKKELQPVVININETRLEITVRTLDGIGKSFITLRGWEAIETLRGQQFDFIVIDEIASMRNWESNWQEVIRPTLTDTKGEAMFISTPSGFNHFYTLYNKEATDIDYKSFHFTSYDNPHLPATELDKAKEELTEDRFAQEYLADFRRTEGLVYKEFDRTKHLFENYSDIKRTVEKLAGVDFGYTNPSVVLVIDRDGDDNYWVRSEWYKTKQTNEQLIEYARTLSVNKFYPDPAEPDRIEEMRRAGMNVREVSKEIEKGIDSVRALFKNGKLKIHTSCENLIFELETYHYPEKRPDKNEPELPVGENDHALDSLRYVLHMQKPVGSSMEASQFYPRGRISDIRKVYSKNRFDNMFKTSSQLEVVKEQKAYVHYPARTK